MAGDCLPARLPDHQETLVQGATGNDAGLYVCHMNGFARQYLVGYEGMLFLPQNLRVMAVPPEQHLVGIGSKKQCRFAVSQNADHA